MRRFIARRSRSTLAHVNAVAVWSMGCRTELCSRVSKHGLVAWTLEQLALACGYKRSPELKAESDCEPCAGTISPRSDWARNRRWEFPTLSRSASHAMETAGFA